jgi:aldehyde dehydrogenase (NAD+)
MPTRKWGAYTPGRPGVGKALSPAGNGEGLVDRTAKLYIGGKQARPDGDYSYPVLDPKGKLAGYAGDSNRKDVRNAVEAAHGPRGGPTARRTTALRSSTTVPRTWQRAPATSAPGCGAMTGQSKQAAAAEVDLSISRLFSYASYADKFGGSLQETTLYGLVVALTEPVGVIGIACPDEYPLLGFVSLLAPAIARGNTVVIIPSSPYPLGATDFYQVLDTSDLPDGVVNILTGNRDHLTRDAGRPRRRQCHLVLWRRRWQQARRGAVADNMKRTWVSYGKPRDWTSPEQGMGREFLRHATEIKNVWVPMGE